MDGSGTQPTVADGGTESGWSRRLWLALEAVHAITYFAPETRAATDSLGLKGGWMSYFACRAAPLGEASAELVTAVFYGFHRDLVARSIPAAWRLARPQQVLDARLAAVDQAMRRIFGGMLDGEQIAEAAELAALAALAAPTAGRPLAAANAALDLPVVPHLRLWSALTLLRESRGDGHVAALVAGSLDPCESLITAAAAADGPPAEGLRAGRRWSEQEWQAASARLRDRGLLDAHGELTRTGLAVRATVEEQTDRLVEPAWAALSDSELWRLETVGIELSQRLVAMGALPVPNPIGLIPPTGGSRPIVVEQ